MFECKVTVHMPDLLLATDKLAALLRGTAPSVQATTPAVQATTPAVQATTPAVQATTPAVQQPAIPQAAPQPMPVNPTPAAPVNTTPQMNTTQAAYPSPTPVGASAPAAPAPNAPAQNAVPIVPTAQAPQYTIEAISRAGAALVQAGKRPELQTLLQQFSVQALTQLQPEQYGPFATALRGLGAQI